MEENEFVIKKEGSILQVYLGFELSMANSTTLREMLSEYRGQDINRIVYDATDLVFLSSSGIRTILFAMQEIGDEPEIVFVNCANEICETFKIAGLANFFSFIDDERKAGHMDGKIRQEQLDKFAAHNDVVACQMKLGQNEDE